MLIAQVDKGYDHTEDDYRITTYPEGGEVTVRISNPDAENCLIEDLTPDLAWLNSARITTDGDAVYLSVSIGDPRGAFGFTVRRLTDGQIMIHTPHENESLLHMKLKQIRPGTLQVIHDNGEPYRAINDPQYWIVFIDATRSSAWKPDRRVEIYEDPSVVYEDSGQWRSPADPVQGYITLGEVSQEEAEKALDDLGDIIEQWENEEIELDDIPDIEY